MSGSLRACSALRLALAAGEHEPEPELRVNPSQPENVEARASAFSYSGLYGDIRFVAETVVSSTIENDSPPSELKVAAFLAEYDGRDSKGSIQTEAPLATNLVDSWIYISGRVPALPVELLAGEQSAGGDNAAGQRRRA